MAYYEIKTIKFLAGSEINNALNQAFALAVKDNCFVKFIFNGIKFEITGYSDLKDELSYYNREIKNINQQNKGI